MRATRKEFAADGMKVRKVSFSTHGNDLEIDASYETIKVKDNQILLDIALQYYGTAEAIAEILANNPGIKNDPQALLIPVAR
mgnify:CR=1 FL=1